MTRTKASEIKEVLKQVPARLRCRLDSTLLQHWDITEDAIIAPLAPGWAIDDVHYAHGVNMEDFVADLQIAVRCACPDCQRRKAERRNKKLFDEIPPEISGNYWDVLTGLSAMAEALRRIGADRQAEEIDLAHNKVAKISEIFKGEI